MSYRFCHSAITIVLSGGCALLFIAAAKPPASQSAPAPGGQERHFLWKVTDVPVPFYILGSSHALRTNDYPLGHAIDQAIDQCRRFVFECDFKHYSGDWEQKLKAAAHYPKGVTLQSKVTPKTFAILCKISNAPSAYESVKPWAVAEFLYGNKNAYGISLENGVESYVQRRAGLSAEIAGLETPEEHVRVLSDMSDIESEVYLLQTLAYSDRYAKEHRDIVAAWKHGDTHRLISFFNEEEHEAPYIVQRLVTKRNANWVPRIEAEMHTGKPTMIVVGARHLCGPYNVIDLLRARGHKLEQL
jgi:uncharacterized protein YbaP (TraB family)